MIPVVNYPNILLAVFSKIFFLSKIIKQNCKQRKAAHFLMKNLLINVGEFDI